MNIWAYVPPNVPLSLPGFIFISAVNCSLRVCKWRRASIDGLLGGAGLAADGFEPFFMTCELAGISSETKYSLDKSSQDQLMLLFIP